MTHISTNDIQPSDLNDLTLEGVSGIILGTIMWLMAVIGVITIITGIYRLITANKDGDADEINVGMLRLILGILFLALPGILRALNIISY